MKSHLYCRAIPGALFLLTSLSLSIPCTAAEQEGIARDIRTGDFVVTYKGVDDQGNEVFQQVIFVPGTKIEPSLKSKFSFDRNDRIQYRYKLTNRSTSLQNIDLILITASSAVSDSLAIPEKWNGTISINIEGGGNRVAWAHWKRGDDYAGLAAGRSESGFGYMSIDLPGVGVVQLSGATPVFGFPDEGPDPESEVGKQLNQLETNDFVPRLAAIPRIPNPAPFNAVVVLGGIQKHVQEEMAAMQLIDPVLLGLIDRGLTQAIAAAQIGNTSSLLHEIKNLRKLLKQEHADVDQDNDGDDDDEEKQPKPRIAKLAAKVLDFDLKYIEKRTKGDKD